MPDGVAALAALGVTLPADESGVFQSEAGQDLGGASV
jgi:hypothetical protein